MSLSAGRQSVQESMNRQNTIALLSSCPLCCEDYHTFSAASYLRSAVIFSTCSHTSCRACLINWFEKGESLGHTPTCPFCRLPVSERDLTFVLGRSFRPRPPGRSASNASFFGDEEIDDMTLQWLEDRTVPCPGCESRVEKTGGCNTMTRLCGYQFCYSCHRSPSERCACGRGDVFRNGHNEAIDNGYVRDKMVKSISGLQICK